MRTPIKEIEIEGDDEAHTIMQVAQRLPPQYIFHFKVQSLNIYNINILLRVKSDMLYLLAPCLYLRSS